MENDLNSEIFTILKTHFDTTPSAKSGHLVGISEEDLITVLSVSGIHVSADDLLKGTLVLSQSGRIYLDDSDGGIPNYARGGANHHYRYRIPQEAQTTKVFPHKIPRGTTWENVIITFLSPENVRIEIKGKKHETNFDEMGLKDKRDEKPDNQWIFLRSLAQKGGEISWKDSDAQKRYKKTVQLLADALKLYIPIEYDPFFPYKQTSSYKVKMTLIPDTDSNTVELEQEAHELLESNNY